MDRQWKVWVFLSHRTKLVLLRRTIDNVINNIYIVNIFFNDKTKNVKKLFQLENATKSLRIGFISL